MPVLILAEDPNDALIPVAVDADGFVKVALQAITSGGCSIHKALDIDESPEEIKGSAGQLYGMIVHNLSASVRYLKFYNAAVASVTVGTTTPVMTIPIQTTGTTNGSGWSPVIPVMGIPFSNGISIAATTGLADADTGAPGANEIVGTFWYK
jgi:hypothetical protein